ncbi:MAG: heat-inducible transcriptional repressor HrcA [Candidatus Omnitrophica bacterium]|nr:heat-inducible transcriptional repressor HrcA [Candidatus Omnitrophota bacterium]
MLKSAKKREEAVLEIIVRIYTESAEPVGSRFIARKLGLSSATIRNVMSDLEEAGFLTHPHTSAGRIPTDKGYRYYVNSLMHRRSLNYNIVHMVEEQYNEKIRSLEDVLEKTSHLMSSLTNYVGVTLLPETEKVYLDGASHLIEQPEFHDIKKLHSLFKCLEDKVNILKLLCDGFDDDSLTIHIGKENKSNYLSECSIVTRGYKVKGRRSGKLGVIGPKRMVYERVVPMVELLADTVSGILEDAEL